jgi:DNA-binding MarR family transcriptional regulator
MNKQYIRFLHLTQALLDGSTHLEGIDETAKHLLNVIAVSYANGKALTVTEAMSMKSVASPATIHRKLDALLELGLVEQTFEGKNRRTKYLVPTKLADKHFSSLGNAMMQVLSTS